MRQPTVQQWKLTANLVATLTSMAENCQSMNQLKQIHAHSISTNLANHFMILAKMIRFAAVSPFGDLSYAHRLFDQMPQPSAFSYNTIIRGYAKSTFPAYSVYFFNRMRRNCVEPDEFSFNFLIKARSRLLVNDVNGWPLVMKCDEIHGAVLKFGFCSHLFVQNALIHLYAVLGNPVAAQRVFVETVGVDVVSWSSLVLAHVKVGELELARQVFDEMPQKDVVSWTAMISGYSKAKHSREAFKLFWEMTERGMRPDEVTVVSVISACKNLHDVEMGIAVHSYIDENGFGWMIPVCNSLIDMYAKCGCVERAWQVFNNMSRRSLITWNSMISACASNGDAEDAFWLFDCLLNAGIAPDGVTLLALLSAYSRKGLVDEGCRLFERMQRDYGIKAGIEHYGCMVDMLGQAGRLEEAYNLITNMPIPSNDIVWEALLAACRTYGHIDIGERVVKKLMDLNPDGRYYFVLRDIYATAGQTTEGEI